MKNIALALLAVSVGILSLLLYTKSAALREQQLRVEQLTSNLESTSKSANLDIQERCAKQAREEFTDEGYKIGGAAVYSSHYNLKLNHCFVQIQNTEPSKRPGEVMTSILLIDAFEGKVYGNYLWTSRKDKKFWEVPPIDCKVTPPSGEEIACHSSDEFNAVVKQYME